MKPQKKPLRMTNGMPHQARRRFGQNFLHDQAVIQRIVAAINSMADDHLLEIGPGHGAITEALAGSQARLDCVELDRDLASSLQIRYQDNPRVNIHQQDILKFDLLSLFTHEPPSDAESTAALRVIGNLPYNISTPVLFHLLKHHNIIRDMTFMLQLEVVQRLAARVGEKNYGRLGLMAQYYCEIEHLFNVPSAAFTPRPRVSSAIVRLIPHRRFPVAAKDVGCLETVIRSAFNQRRKTLKNGLKTIISEDRLVSLDIDIGRRPENLSLAEFVLISDALADERKNRGSRNEH